MKNWKPWVVALVIAVGIIWGLLTYHHESSQPGYVSQPILSHAPCPQFVTGESGRRLELQSCFFHKELKR